MGLSKLFNRFSKGDKDKGSANNNHGHGDCIGDKGKLCQCRILFLDDTDLCLDVKTGAKGHQVLNRVFDYLNLLEKDYFGLRYLDETNQTHWLDPSKNIGSQLKTLPPHTLYFGVKFYAADPCKLREELTKYQFFLQVKRDILQGRLPVQFDLSVELAAYAVQSELGDYEAKRHSYDYVSEFRFVPIQTEEFEERAMRIHKSLVGIVPSAAEYRYLDKSKWLDMYGVDLHPVQGECNLEYFLGLTPTGIVVFRNKQKVGNYFWPRLNKVTFKGKMFMIRVKDRNKEENTYAFECASKPACKHLWKCCIEHHAFFRLTSSNESYSATGRFLIFGSKHRYSGRTEKQALADSANRPPPKVVRKPSKRHQRRSSADSLPNGYPRNREASNVIVMGPSAEPKGRDRGYNSAPESPRSHRSAPWDNNRHSKSGLFTSGRSSPTSEYSERIMFPRRQYESESEGGPKRRAHRSRVDHSDSEAEYRAHRAACRVPAEYTDASESEAEFRKHRKYRKSLENVAPHEVAWVEQQRRIRDGGYQGPFQLRPNGSLISVASGESSSSRRRRRRSRSPGNRKPPEELAEHFKYVDPGAEGISNDQLRDIAYTAVDTATDASLKAKAHKRHRSKSPRNKHSENAEKLAAASSSAPCSLVNAPASSNAVFEQPPPPYSETTHHNHPTAQPSQPAPQVAKMAVVQPGLHPPIQPTYGTARNVTSSSYVQQHSQYNTHSPYRIPEPADFQNMKSPASIQRNEAQTAPIVRTNYAKNVYSSPMSNYSQPPSYTTSGQSMYSHKQSSGKVHHEHVREDSGLGIDSNPSSTQGSPASYTNGQPTSQIAYVQPQYQQHYTEQVSSKSSHSNHSHIQHSNHSHIQHSNQQPHINSHQGNHRNQYPSNQHYPGNQQYPSSNHQYGTAHMSTANTRRIHSSTATNVKDHVYGGQYQHMNGATQSQKTTDL